MRELLRTIGRRSLVPSSRKTSSVVSRVYIRFKMVISFLRVISGFPRLRTDYMPYAHRGRERVTRKSPRPHLGARKRPRPPDRGRALLTCQHFSMSARICFASYRYNLTHPKGSNRHRYRGGPQKKRISWVRCVRLFVARRRPTTTPTGYERRAAPGRYPVSRLGKHAREQRGPTAV